MVNESFITLLEKEGRFEKSPEELQPWLNLLLPLEHEIIDILNQTPYPLSVKGIVDELVNSLWNDAKNVWDEIAREDADNVLWNALLLKENMNAQMTAAKEVKEMQRIKEYFLNIMEERGKKLASFPQVIVLWRGRHFPGEVKTTCENLMEVVTYLDVGKPPSNQIEQKKGNLIKKELVSIPDPRRIERILEGLEDLGITISRELPDKKTKKVYALNPKARLLFKKLSKN